MSVDIRVIAMAFASTCETKQDVEPERHSRGPANPLIAASIGGVAFSPWIYDSDTVDVFRYANNMYIRP